MLLELTNKEQELQGLGVKVTLKEIANKYSLRHDNLKRDFKLLTSRLNEEERNLLKFEEIDFTDKRNRKQETIEMDFVTTIWFIAKFDESLRLKIVLYAVNKFKEEKNLELEQKDKLLEDTNKEINQLKEENEKLKEQVKKKKQRFRDYGIESHATVSRFLEEIGEFNYKNRDKLFALLVTKNIIEYEKVCNLKSKIIDFKVGKEVSVKSGKGKVKVKVYDKDKLSKIWKENKHKDLSLLNCFSLLFPNTINIKPNEE
jgi:septal ring factor EnvC (AmiA/AmiB activator)